MSSRNGDTYGVRFFHNKLFGPVSGSKVIVHFLHAVGAMYKRYLYLYSVASSGKKICKRMIRAMDNFGSKKARTWQLDTENNAVAMLFTSFYEV